MRTRLRRGVIVALALLAVAGTAFVANEPAGAHGATQLPASRTYLCKFILPSSPACASAWAANPQALYDWNEVNLANAAGNHQALIPDGKLCSAGREKYSAFDVPRTDWPATPVTAGPTTITYTVTAPHATQYLRYYLTKAGFDPTKPLRWSDLELVYDSGPRAAATGYAFPVTLPARTGRHILYSVWQRSDSPEAFYGCSDVTYVPGAPALPAADPSAPPPPPQLDPAVIDGEAELTFTVSSDWGTGYCAGVTASNPGTETLAWFGHWATKDTLTSSWEAQFTVHDGMIHAVGLPWNRLLAPGASTSFGYCAKRGTATPPSTTTTTKPTTTTTKPTTTTTKPTTTTTKPTTTTTKPPSTTTTRPTTTTTTPATSAGITLRTTVDTDWGTGWCARVEVTNTSASSVRWTAAVPLRGTLTSLWGATGAASGGVLRVSGDTWNATLASKGTTQFGYCAAR